MMWFDPAITDLLRNLLPGLDVFFFWVSQLGGEVFYIAALLTVYWTVSKREGILASYILLFSLIANFWLKMAIAKDRPPSSYWYVNSNPPNYSTPSGHSQNAATLYGWFTHRVREWWVALIATVLTLLVGISRIYIGVHYLEDVLLGWGIGIATVLVIANLEKPMSQFFSRYRTDHLLLLLMTLGFVMTLVAAVIPQPPNDNFGAYGGVTIGFALGLILEMRFVNFSIESYDGKKWRLVARVVIGLVLVILVMAGLLPILPTEQIWLRALRYCLIALTGVFLWPLIFTKAKL